MICYVTLWPRPLTRWSWKFLVHQASCDQSLCKLERNRSIPGCVIDDLALFRVQFRGGSQLTELSRCWVDPTSPSLAISLHRVIIAALYFYFTIRISCCIYKRMRFKAEWCLKRRQILHFLTLVKIKGGWERSLYQLLKLYLLPNLRNTFDGHPLHGCWAEWIDIKKKRHG